MFVSCDIFLLLSDRWHPFVSIPPSNFIFRGKPASCLRSVFSCVDSLYAQDTTRYTLFPWVFWRRIPTSVCQRGETTAIGAAGIFHKRNCRARERNRTLFNLMSHSRVWLIFPEFCPTTDKKYFTGPRDGEAGVGSQKCIRLRQWARGN